MQWAALRADRSTIPGAVEELLRWTTPVISFMRTATGPTTIRGIEVASGDPVLLVYASANRDEAVFGADAGELRIDRHPNPHVSFGFGPHFCLGAALARLEARVVLGELLERYESVELAGGGRADGQPGHRRGTSCTVNRVRLIPLVPPGTWPAQAGSGARPSRQPSTLASSGRASCVLGPRRPLGPPGMPAGTLRPGSSIQAATAPSAATTAPAMQATSSPLWKASNADRWR